MTYETYLGRWEIRNKTSIVLTTKERQEGEKESKIIEHLYNFNMFGSQAHKILPLDFPSKLEVSNPFNWEVMAKEIDFKWYI
jgi:hypothetical protein